MRRLVWIAAGFASGAALYVFWLGSEDLRPVWILLFAAALLAAVPGRSNKSAKAAALLLLGCGCAFFWSGIFESHYLSPAAQLDGATRESVITLSDYSFVTGYGRAADGTMQVSGKDYAVRVYMEEGELLQPGTVIKGSFRFRLTIPGSEQGATSHAGKGIFLLAYQKGDVECFQGTEDTFSMKASRLRRYIGDTLKAVLPEDVYPFAKALLLGDTTDLSHETDTLLKVSGIRHVAAVSGLHVSILFALVMHLTFRKRFLSAFLGIPVLFLFAAVAGFTPSVNRACLMSGLMLLAQVVKKEYDGLTALSFAALVMLLCNPLVICSVSFQLSCASVAGIFLFSGKVSGWVRNHMGSMTGKSLGVRTKRWFAASVSTTLGAMVLTTPLCAVYFGTVSLIGVVTNLLTLWLISGIFYLLIGIYGLAMVSPAAAVLLGQLTAALIRLVLWVAELLASFPLACVYTVSEYIVFWLVFVYALLILMLVLPKRRPGMAVLCSILGLCLALLCSWAEPMLYDTSITVLDVGQGQCILLQSQGRNYLIDCGGDSHTAASDTAAAWLLSRGISRLDGVIVTHMDKDHAGGVANLLSRMDAELLILPPVWSELANAQTNVLFADRPLELAWADTKLSVLGEKSTGSKNENGLCILLDTPKCDILITGDRTAAAEARMLQFWGAQDVDILIAGHHGSGDATSEALLQAVRPEIVCISVGADNIYGHPAKETLQRLYNHGCVVYRTDLHGTITIRR